jgi:hypothetical protein
MPNETSVENKKTPPYGVFATFKNSLEQLAQGIPNQIDRTVFPGMAWNAQNQLITALRFFGLIDENGKPTEKMHLLTVPNEDERKAQLGMLLRVHYAPLFALDLMKATPGQLDQCITEVYGATGDTRLKVVRFFLSALAYLDIPVSSLFGRTKVGPGGTNGVRRRRTLKPRAEEPGDLVPKSDDKQIIPASGTARVVTLTSGGTLTISVSLDLLRLSAADRQFVFGLIDKLEEYEQKKES